MKFLCDRCKTRYSIGDDRVRGKILKIRCKNCANVITVREGMAEAEDGAVALDRRARPTTAAPMAAASAPAGSALASAFVAQLTKPPPALEEEWYVSIDGDQSGPFSLADAQRWIAGKSTEVDLHCWSEGFDDWLPVDKVSHFRGLRKKPPAPAAPPPMPRAAPRAAAPQAQQRSQPIEDEPKPLFAATMASLEKAGGAAPERGLGLPPIASAPTLKGPTPATPVNGIAAKANGTGAAAVPKLNDSGRVAKIPAVAKPPVPLAQLAKPISEPTRAPTVQGVGSTQSAGAKALAAAFDTGADVAEPSESMTTVDAPAFVDEIATSAEPIAAKRAFDRVDAVSESKARAPSPPAEADMPEMPEDESLEIGEVSRVVKLADLAKMGAPARKVSRAPLMRATGSNARLDPAALSAASTVPGDPALAALQQPIAETGEIQIAAPVVAQAHRRGLIMLIGVAAVLLIGVAVAVFFIVQNGNGGDTGGGLGPSRSIDTSRPEEVVRAHMNDPGTGSGSAIATLRPHHNINTGNPNHLLNGSADETPGDPKGARLKAEEIEDMAHKQEGGTQRCYMRAQKGVEGIELGDLKKLSVTLTVDKTGTVTEVEFTEHGPPALAACLSNMIKHWKFRESPGGTYRFVMAFAN